MIFKNMGNTRLLKLQEVVASLFYQKKKVSIYFLGLAATILTTVQFVLTYTCTHTSICNWIFVSVSVCESKHWWRIVICLK